jgi:hypothetical protein
MGQHERRATNRESSNVFRVFRAISRDLRRRRFVTFMSIRPIQATSV